jgi:hypothetical protein
VQASSAQIGNDAVLGIEIIIGSQGNDSFLGNNGANVFDGHLGNDFIDGNPGNDTINGGVGNDTIWGGTGNDTLNGGADNDTFFYAIGDGTDTIDGGLGSDSLSIIGPLPLGVGNQSLTVAYSGAGFAAISTTSAGGAGPGFSNIETFTADLGTGSDSLIYTNTTTASVTVDLALGTASGFTSITNIESATGGSGSDTLIGTSLAGVAGTLTGGSGSDVINMGAPDDNVADFVRFNAATDFSSTSFDTVSNFDATGTAAQVDKVQFGLALNTLFDNGTNNDVFLFNTANAAGDATNQAVNLATIEALILDGTANNGVTSAQLNDATAVANEFNAEFAITAGVNQATLLVINDTNAGSNIASVWQYVETGAVAEIQAGELTLIALINANATVQTADFAFV